MDFRRVVKIKKSLYVNIPRQIADALGMQAGERLKVAYVAGSGIFITQVQGADKIPINPKNVDGLQKAADFIYSDVARKLTLLESAAVANYHASMIKEISRLGIFELQKKVDGLEKQVVGRTKEKGKLTLVRRRK